MQTDRELALKYCHLKGGLSGYLQAGIRPTLEELAKLLEYAEAYQQG